jgi:hypothetical protein
MILKSGYGGENLKVVATINVVDKIVVVKADTEEMHRNIMDWGGGLKRDVTINQPKQFFRNLIDHLSRSSSLFLIPEKGDSEWL